ncbi:related to non-ribosomal peptide synthetase modules and related proteins [Ramularia collo-cygni]|uniref:Related to non-ribosomal peptide synthetase modules and related proteins n=1 Tax=Ramularia collo-cygni TaxID=112498 RepID=A0A2D3UUA7_9PEZI|nr:related to non-ribosomal peptide synthetase modules and related proteins [Ramularia collo-cygni]CZT21192.1 related to non-ribosomal peptide synthetase modules and related proteins [Ramularia collo-cygni]
MAVEPIFKTQFPEELIGKDQVTFEWIEKVTRSPEHYEALVREAFDDTRIGSHFCVVTLAEPGQQSISNIIWIVHHALIDGYSASLLFEKIRKYTTGVAITAGPSFAKLAAELHQYQADHGEEGKRFWMSQNDQLALARGDLMLPTAIQDTDGNTSSVESEAIEIVLDQNELEDVLAGSQSKNVTMATILQAAWALVLSHYTSSDLVVFGTVLASRNLPLPGILDTIGPMVNTLPLCVAVDAKLSIQEYLRAVFKQMVRLSEFSWTTPNEHDYSRQFESAVAMQFDTTADAHTYQPFLPIENPKSKQTTSIPFSVAMNPDGTIHLQAHKRRVTRTQAQDIAQMLRDAIIVLVRSNGTIGDCKKSLLSVDMLATLRERGNANSGLTTIPSVTEDLVTLFEQSARNVPNDVAVERGSERVSYASLDEQSSVLASYLLKFIRSGEVVCAHADRSTSWIVAIWGILKAGAVYCALDPSLPAELKDSMYKAANAKAFVAPSAAVREACPLSCGEFVDIETVLRFPDTEDAQHNMLSGRDLARPADAAYLCFTSGSTGVPKGVICTHRGLVAFQSDLEVRLFARPGERIAQIMSPGFDGAIHEIFSALCYGATLVLPQEGSQMFDHLHKATSCILTPSIARILNPEDYPGLQTVYFVGEPVPPAVSDIWSSHVALYNMYGPTEGTCGATIKRLLPGQQITIGKPNPATRIYIMRDNHTLVPPGVIGEIFLAGVQVAKGYIGLPEVTADRFRPDPICPIGEYMYKTGDRGYWNDEGDLVCLGRNDREIKLRGFRLDMNDLEIRIARADSSLQAVAVVVHNEQLVSIVQPADVDVAMLHATISRSMARHQRPARILAIDTMPTTRAGKTDYLALMKLLSKPEAIPREHKQGPASPTLRKVIAVVRSILQLEQGLLIRNDASFDELGGTSLKQVALCSRLSKEFGIQVPLRLIIERPRLSAVADAVDVMLSSSQHLRISPCQTIDRQRASPGELEWFEKYLLDVGLSAFNVFYAATFSPARISRKRLTEAWNIVLLRHAILRSRYAKQRGNRGVRLLSDCAPRVQAVSEISFWTEVNRPFYVGTNDPIRVLIGEDKMMVVISHIIADFTALAVLLEEVNLIYHGRQLPPLVKTYDEADVWFKDTPVCYKKWWLEYLSSLPKEPIILKPEKERKSYYGTSIVSKMPKSLCHNMRETVSKVGVSMQQLLLGAIALVLSCEDDPNDTEVVDVLLGSPYMNRPTDDDLSVVGLYLEPLPVRITYPFDDTRLGKGCDAEEAGDQDSGTSGIDTPSTIIQDDSVRSYLEIVRRSCQMALAHAMPWHQLLELMGCDVAYPAHPLFDIMVSFHEVSQTQKIGNVIPGVEPCFAWSEGSKFKLMVECAAYSNDVLMLRLEHDTEVFTKREIYRIETMVPQVLDMLTRDSQGMTISAIREALKAVEGEVRPTTALEPGKVFGKAISEL